MADEEFPDFELVPDDSEEAPDDELAEVLDPDEFDDMEGVDDSTPIGRTTLTDWGTMNRGSRPAWVQGNDAVVQVAQVALRTRRSEHPMFSDDFGMDDPDALLGYPEDLERQAAYQADVVETLLACHDRITSVGDFEFIPDESGEIVFVNLVMEIDQGDEDTEEVTLEGVLTGG